MELKEIPYHIYCHADADGGIAAAMIATHLKAIYPEFSPKIDPVNHGGGGAHGWSLRPIVYPCAILDFTIHPLLFERRFFKASVGHTGPTPPCIWADHHPTGSTLTFLKPDDIYPPIPGVKAVWDIQAISTPSLLRKHKEFFGLSDDILNTFEELIDLADVIDGALFATPESAHDFSSPAVILQALFHCSHPIVNSSKLFKKLVYFLMKTPNFEALYDSDPLYSSLVEFEQTQHYKQVTAYQKVMKREGVVAVAPFTGNGPFEGLGRFIPYLLDPECAFALHIIPQDRKYFSLSCGINPWNKKDLSGKHLGHFFSEHFGGGGHAFVAGAKITTEELSQIENLLSYLNS